MTTFVLILATPVFALDAGAPPSAAAPSPSAQVPAPQAAVAQATITPLENVNPTKVLSRIAFGSCALQHLPQPIWQSVRQTHPDVVVLLGDNIYGDTEDMDFLQKKYDQLARMPEFARLTAEVPLVATWDDHDYGVDDGGADYKKKIESKQIFLKFFNEPQKSVRHQEPGVYASYLQGPVGQRVQIILLDLRWNRSPLLKDKNGIYKPNNDPKATMLGADQWKWLKHELKVPADLRIIGSSTQFEASGHTGEKWANFPREKKRFFDLLKSSKAANTILLSGDMHYGEISYEQAFKELGFWDITSSGLNRFESAATSPNEFRRAVYDQGPNFGILEIDWNNRSWSAQVRDLQGNVKIKQEVKFVR